MKFFHGSNIKFDHFDITQEFIAPANDPIQEGPGIYMTSSLKDAKHYGKYLYQVEWNPSKLLPTKKEDGYFTHLLMKLVKQAPNWKDTAQNWNEEPEEGVQEFMTQLLSMYDTLKEQFEQIWFDWYRNDPVAYIHNVVAMGYDGFIVNKREGVKHAIVFNPATITIVKTNLREAKEKKKEKIVVGYGEIPIIIDYLKQKYSSVSIKDVEKVLEDHFKKIGKDIPKDDDFLNDLYGGITSAGMGIGGESSSKEIMKENKVSKAVQLLEKISGRKVVLKEVVKPENTKILTNKLRQLYDMENAGERLSSKDETTKAYIEDELKEMGLLDDVKNSSLEKTYSSKDNDSELPLETYERKVAARLLLSLPKGLVEQNGLGIDVVMNEIFTFQYNEKGKTLIRSIEKMWDSKIPIRETVTDLETIFFKITKYVCGF